MANEEKDPDLERVGSAHTPAFAKDFVRKISRHQSSHFYQSIEQIRNFETMEDKCKKVVLNHLGQFEDEYEEEVLQTIFDFVDIPPLNRFSKFEASMKDYIGLFDYISKNGKLVETNDTIETKNEEISDADLEKLQKKIDLKWTIGETKNSNCPQINKDTLYGVYFADIQSQIVKKYQIVGCIRDEQFIRVRDNIDKNVKLVENWDPCMDIYFYIVCYETGSTATGSSQFKGTVCFSNFWSNMLIFGIDEDFIRESCETGEWEFDAVDIIGSPKKSSLMGRRMFLTKKASNEASAMATNKEEGNENDSGIDMLRYLYDKCDIVSIEKDKDKVKEKANEKESESKSELFVICQVKLNDDGNDNVVLMNKDGAKEIHSLQAIVTKYCIREQRDINELKQGLLPLSAKQLEFISKNKIFESTESNGK